MKPEAQRIAIAEFCGPKLYVLHKPIHDPFGYYREDAHGYTSSLDEAWKVPWEIAQKHVSGADYDPDRVIAEPAPLPNYLSDLNAMNVVEEFHVEPNLIEEYAHELYMVLERFWTVDRWAKFTRLGIDYAFAHATAAQRAEALLRTIGKWTE